MDKPQHTARVFSEAEQQAAYLVWVEERANQAKVIACHPPEGLTEALQTAREALEPFYRLFPWPTMEWQDLDAVRRGLERLEGRLRQAQRETGE
jgi:hypothetical protein